MPTRRVTSGHLLIATGVIHQVVGVIAGLGVGDDLGGRNLLLEVARLGVVDSIGADFARMAMFWFLLSGCLILMLGSLLHQLERRDPPLPASIGWQLGALSIAGVLFIPASGFWLVIPQAWWIVHKARGGQRIRD